MSALILHNALNRLPDGMPILKSYTWYGNGNITHVENLGFSIMFNFNWDIYVLLTISIIR